MKTTVYHYRYCTIWRAMAAATMYSQLVHIERNLISFSYLIVIDQSNRRPQSLKGNLNFRYPRWHDVGIRLFSLSNATNHILYRVLTSNLLSTVFTTISSGAYWLTSNRNFKLLPSPSGWINGELIVSIQLFLGCPIASWELLVTEFCELNVTILKRNKISRVVIAPYAHYVFNMFQ